MEGQFKVCTNCGHMLVKRRDGAPVKELFDEDLHSKSGIIRLLGCAACGAAVADKYIEYEGVLILIDLVLQAKEAYRHVIFNGDYTRLILKMTLLTVICDGYIGWASLSSAGEFFEQEYQFYVLCAKAALALLCFVCVALPLALVRTSGCGGSVRICLLGLLMAYSARFCNLAALLWADDGSANGGARMMWNFVYLLFFVTTLRVVQVSQDRNFAASAAVAGLAHAAFNAVNQFDFVLNPVSCPAGSASQ